MQIQQEKWCPDAQYRNHRRSVTDACDLPDVTDGVKLPLVVLA
jgi:hypothetical protein